ncbi:transposase [Nonomuraea sp. NBC_01738]|uniref:RNA-guided endonuclease InsQ/TnpB family protein n=1 Tax=Nonomuraea sp. NBC_01738 TaxID=2976003 RepID=UPI002E0FEEC0|nr:transposase [Nonomuraea sp. NBC_01738]
MVRVVKRAYRYRFHPTPEQAAELARTFGCVRYVYHDGELRLAKMRAPLAIVWSRPLPPRARPSTVTVSRDSIGRWFVSILVEEAIRPLPPTNRAVGLDMGITTLVTTSSGEKIANLGLERAARRKLARAQRSLSRKQEGSANRGKARLRVAKIYARTADRRRDHLHKISSRLVRENQVIAVEDLSVRNLIRNHRLARSVADASWRELRLMLEYKAAWYGRELVVVDRWFPSSKLCRHCGVVREELPLSSRAWRCVCGAEHDRDVNAARNILAAGLADR